MIILMQEWGQFSYNGTLAVVEIGMETFAAPRRSDEPEVKSHPALPHDADRGNYAKQPARSLRKK